MYGRQALEWMRASDWSKSKLNFTATLGHCMFHAIAFFVHNDKKMHMVVRKRVVQHMQKRSEFFTQFFPCPCHQNFPKDLDEEQENKWSFQAHLKDMVCSEDAWGSETELAAIAEGWHDACVVSGV